MSTPKSTASDSKPSASRRTFIKGSGALLASGAIGGGISVARGAHAYGSDTIKIGLVGCGGRGAGASVDALNTGDVQLVAMADVFENQLKWSLGAISSRFPDKVKVDPDAQGVGLDGYKRVMESDCDVVILATAPGFRPLHFEAAINAGKHVFMEKPVATDAAGVRRVLKAGELAKEKGLAVQVGLQRRHQFRYQDVVNQLHDGAIGEFVLGRAYWNSGGVWVRNRQPQQTELEYQLRNWYYFNWICGDHINEQHIHNLDVINWVMQDYPVSAQGQGGREVRNGKNHGQIFDHHMIEFTYPGAHKPKMLSQCRHIGGCWGNVSEHIHGTTGFADIGGATIYNLDGSVKWRSDKPGVGGHAQEHVDLFKDLRNGETPNEAEYGAKSTMTAILGRMATYSGKSINWDQAINCEKTLADFDSLHSLDQDAPVSPNEQGDYPVPRPGQYNALA